MTPEQFIATWKAAELSERAAAQSHFLDLCELLDEPKPHEADPKGEWYTFERGALKTTGGKGWADVWKRGHFGWEYKGRGRDLTAAFAQLQRYAIALENPPLLVVCDHDRFRIHTNWTNSVSRIHEITLDDLRDPAQRQKLKWVFSDPERLKPDQTRQELTEEAASEFATLALRLRDRGHDPQAVAHFVNRLVFCMFAEDVELLPGKMFSRMLNHALKAPDDFQALASDLFAAMRAGGRVGFEKVDWFNGGLFDSATALALEKTEIELTVRAAEREWGDIDPTIFGTLFERGLDPDKRSQLGAHYTDRDKIMMIVEPVIRRPWRAEWEAVKEAIMTALKRADEAKASGAKAKARAQAAAFYRGFLDRLRAFRVLDPACGSGNFLYLALHALKDLEHRAEIEAEALGLPPEFPQIGPESVRGIEVNLYAAELARVCVWIGEIQWMRRNGFVATREPILKPLDNIESRDAVLSPDGTEAVWPTADVIIGNPPFLGDKAMIGVLGEDYVQRLRSAYGGRVPGGADLVCFWFEKARDRIETGASRRAGLVATNSIRGGANRRVLDRIGETQLIFEAWSDEPWVVEGASVRVSLVCFGSGPVPSPARLNGHTVATIFTDLTSAAVDLTKARILSENEGVSFIGTQKGGAFDVPGDLARQWLILPTNPNGRRNADVLRPWANGFDVTRRSSGRWVIDFGADIDAQAAALYEAPFRFIEVSVKPLRDKVRREGHRRYWWRHAEARPGMRHALSKLSRYIATPRVSKHRIFVWLDKSVLPDCQLVVIAREDDTTFGILHSRFHEAWALRLGTSLEDRPRYSHDATFKTFPFPPGLAPTVPATSYASDPRAMHIAEAARRLNALRENRLNPPDLVRRMPEVVPGFPDRLLPLDDDKAAAILRKRTLTALYNERPAWLDHAHRELDAAVAAAYGWPAAISDDDALTHLFALNQQRFAVEAGALAAQ